jgi:hypothetical protein
VPVLFMSGFDEHLASDTVAGPVLPKPFTAERLDELIRQVLAAGRAIREAEGTNGSGAGRCQNPSTSMTASAKARGAS